MDEGRLTTLEQEVSAAAALGGGRHTATVPELCGELRAQAAEIARLKNALQEPYEHAVSAVNNAIGDPGVFWPLRSLMVRDYWLVIAALASAFGEPEEARDAKRRAAELAPVVETLREWAEGQGG